MLFNLGAVHSQMGLSFDRSSVEGRRQASHSFIAAAGAFVFLRDNVAVKASVGGSTTLDVSVECAGMLERLMLAQAQECVYENTIAKGSSPGVCAKISRQVCHQTGTYLFAASGFLCRNWTVADVLGSYIGCFSTLLFREHTNGTYEFLLKDQRYY